MSLINPNDSIERQNEKLIRITNALIRRVEDKTNESGLAYAQFERAALLDAEVRRRTEDLERALDLLHESNSQLSDAKRQAETARSDLADAIETIHGGFGLFGPDDMLILSNSRFCRELDDLPGQLWPGLSFNEYVNLVSDSSSLDLADGESRSKWRAARLERHGDGQVAFNVRLKGNRWLQINEHRTSTGGTVVLQTDVTDLMLNERAERQRLRDNQALMLKATLDHLDQAVCIFDDKLRLAGWNSRMVELFRIGSSRANGRLALPFARLLKMLAREFDFGDGFGEQQLLDWSLKRSGRHPIWFEIRRREVQILNVFAQEIPDGGFVISFTDVTQQRRAADELQSLNERLEHRVEARTLELEKALREAERANASKSRFVAAASHDLLQPLSAAKLFVQSLAGPGDSAAVPDIADKATAALSNAERIIEALLDMSRLDIGEATFSISTVPLSSTLASLYHELKPAADAKGLDLRFIPSSVSVFSDASYLRRIVQNLAVNAIRYTPRGRVLVGVRRLGACARIEVHDTGPGIADEERALVFQEFKRLKAARQQDGIGLGLSIVERACASLGHKLELSTEVGKGSCFSVTLPISGSGQPDGFQKSAVSSDTADLRGMIVLVVENDATLARAMSAMIEEWGAQVLTAGSGEDALHMLREIDLAPDTVILDHQLGDGMTGTEFWSRIRGTYGRIPGCLVTANRSATVRDECARLDLEFLVKPIDLRMLAEFLQSAAAELPR